MDMTTDGEGPSAAPARGHGGWRHGVAYSDALAEEICERVADGEVLYTLLGEEGMPTPQSVRRWAKERPEFGEALTEARRAGGRPLNGGGVSSYDEEVAQVICERIWAGESLSEIADDPVMPSFSTIYAWRRRNVEFESAVADAQTGRAERFCDLGWKLAMEATPETAYLTHVRLAQLRWTAGCMAPRKFRLKTLEPDEPPIVKRVMIRRFTIEIDPETDERKVVGWCPNPDTGEVEREDVPGWKPPPGICLPPNGQPFDSRDRGMMR